MSVALFTHGALEPWLADPDVVEVMVNAGGEVWIERRGAERGVERVGALETGELEAIIERILTPIGRRVDRASPIVDARLADGSRVCAVLAPIAVDGTCLAVRRFPPGPRPLRDFAPPAVVALLQQIVAERCNVVVSGSTSSGKTTLLNSLAGVVTGRERIVTIEDVAELRLDAAHVVRLETRPATPDGIGAVDMSQLVRTSLRLRPDRIVVGEVRGDEAVHLLHALNTGHDGSLSTLHANSALDALARLESLVLRGAPTWPLPAVREQVQRSIDVVVHVARGPGGSRRVTEVAEVGLTAGRPSTVRLLADAREVHGVLRRGRR